MCYSLQPGSPNPTVRLHVADLEKLSQGTIKVMEVPPPEELRYSEPILTTVAWGDADRVSAVWMNRVQNVSVVTLCDPIIPSCANVSILEKFLKRRVATVTWEGHQKFSFVFLLATLSTFQLIVEF